MSADELKRAATKLREYAEPAARNMGTSAWKVEALGTKGYPQRITNDRATLIAECFEGVPTFAPYIALMHPPVALALADWLDANAAWMKQTYGDDHSRDLDEIDKTAVAVARSILREEATS